MSEKTRKERTSKFVLTLTAGGDIYTTSKLLGHTSVHTTEIYAEVVNEKKVAAVCLLDVVFS